MFISRKELRELAKKFSILQDTVMDVRHDISELRQENERLRRDAKELREEISNLSLKADSLKHIASFWIFDDPSIGLLDSDGYRLSHSEAIMLLARNAGVRFKCQRGPGDHGVLEPIGVKND
jgi:FtsZ-binding cell division protein ZapB